MKCPRVLKTSGSVLHSGTAPRYHLQGRGKDSELQTQLIFLFCSHLNVEEITMKFILTEDTCLFFFFALHEKLTKSFKSFHICTRNPLMKSYYHASYFDFFSSPTYSPWFLPTRFLSFMQPLIQLKFSSVTY